MRIRTRKVTYYGITFDSRVEGERYLVLRGLEIEGKISDLKCQPVFKLSTDNGPILGLNGKGKQRVYTADFSYMRDGKLIVEDVKPRKKATYKNKLKKDKALIDEASSLRMSIAESQYGFIVNIIF